MNVYVESNFVFELALLQEQSDSCERILAFCESGDARLVIPAYCLAEPYETLTRRHKQRKRMKQEFDREFGQIARTDTQADRLSGFRDITELLVTSVDEEEKRLNGVCSRVSETAEVIPLDARVLAMSREYRREHDFSPQDSIVYASVLAHLAQSPGRRNCFLDKDKDFHTQDIVEELSGHRCELLRDFGAGYGFIMSRND